ncbi:DUF6115 domain-containing protein [Natranaerobius trueperi]|uniref:Uncharacterized protein n=1 Tax=Natranaerobius trueperi TaxID=759412 RepID=A0A226C1G8_9FIRM|nr:hypothetical protein [Natranaerobius trueperi]OWZ84257.1 hypothetical protein CDO51_04155 [Natranaerobius trueperi]
MLLYIITLLVGFIIFIISLFSLSKVNSTKKINNKQEKTHFLASEVLDELESSTDKLIEKISSKEVELEGLLGRADNRISELNNLVQKDHDLLKVASDLQLGSNEFSKKDFYKTLNLYTPGEAINKNKSKKSNKELQTNSSTVEFIPKYLEKHQYIVDMYNDGHDFTEIARRAQKGKGEVQLIINLYKQSGDNYVQNRS